MGKEIYLHWGDDGLIYDNAGNKYIFKKLMPESFEVFEVDVTEAQKKYFEDLLKDIDI